MTQLTHVPVTCKLSPHARTRALAVEESVPYPVLTLLKYPSIARARTRIRYSFPQALQVYVNHCDLDL